MKAKFWGTYLLKRVWLFVHNAFVAGFQEPVNYYLYMHWLELQ
jgi:hypothetical protein